MAPHLLDKIKLDKFYQVGAIISFFIFTTSLTFEIKFLNNIIIAFYSLSFLFYFMGIWANTYKTIGVSHGSRYSTEGYKITIVGLGFYILSGVIFLLAIYQTYLFFV